ncbi:MAG: DNA polymerase III subunit gamma/tau [Candidatus Moranbacteria bacterium]|nr:DNA polymerase III subunit gamma/tau [Candidatus Moranbacteria bacterium]
MSEVLYRKYRPKNFSEIIGQKHIVQTLENAIQNQRISHAYLFTGPRGTGKTSIARIFAKTVNCANLKGAISCEKCQACKLIIDGRSLDIIEIDAASNTGVDNIRELRETVNLQPTALKYKVYIIDEVHMLSTGAFNALLKTLEEPPAHVIFILATTEIHKVPETIISRCQRFDFTRLPIQNIIEKLSLIAKAEDISIDKESLEMIAIAAEGGMRDAESLLAQVMALEDKNITKKEVEEILGTTNRSTAYEIAGQIIADDTAGAIQKINELLENGYDLKVFAKALVNYFRQLMLLKINPELKSGFSYEITQEQLEKMIGQAQGADLLKIVTTINLLLEAQLKISASILPQLPLEIAIVKATHTFPKILPQAENKKSNSVIAQNTVKIINTEHIAQNTEQKKSESLQYEKTEENLETDLDIEKIKRNWNKLLEEIKPHNHSLKALLSNCTVVSVAGQEITIATSYDFYKEKLNERSSRLTVEEVFGSILGLPISIKAVTKKEIGLSEETISKEPASQEKSGAQDGLLNSALEILGGKVINE